MLRRSLTLSLSVGLNSNLNLPRTPLPHIRSLSFEALAWTKATRPDAKHEHDNKRSKAIQNTDQRQEQAPPRFVTTATLAVQYRLKLQGRSLIVVSFPYVTFSKRLHRQQLLVQPHHVESKGISSTSNKNDTDNSQSQKPTPRVRKRPNTQTS